MRGLCPGFMQVQRACRRVAVCGLCKRAVPFAACVVLLACVGGLKFLSYVCAFGGFPL